MFEESNQEKRINKPLIYAIAGVALLVIAVSGSAYAYFTASASSPSNAISGKTLDVQMSVASVERVSKGTGDLIPIYDALYEFMGKENVDKMIEKGVVEIAPLAYMRGRTLDNAMIILDEAQNTTSDQMKMFITRLGFNSKMVITGDVTQIDLPNHITSGLTVATRILTNVPGIAHVQFGKYDVMRHPLVSKIIEKYEENDD